MRRLLSIGVVVLLTAPVFAGDSEAELLQLTEGPIHEALARAWAADPAQLDKWAKKPPDNPKEFCPDYERGFLRELYRGMADYKRSAVSADVPSEPHAAARFAVFKLMTFRPNSVERLRQALALVKVVAPPDGKVAHQAESFVEPLAHPPDPDFRLKVSWEAARCFEDRPDALFHRLPDPAHPEMPLDPRFIRIVISKEGRVTKARTVHLDSNAETVTFQMQFRPYYYLGRAVEIETDAPLR